MLKIAIVTGSTRPGRHNEAVARWVHDLAKTRKDASYELVDIAHYNLPLLDEPIPPGLGKYTHDHTKTWARKIASFDGYVFVTPEYNHSTSAALKNAIDYVFAEWNNKAAGLVGYGSAGGARAIEHLRGILAEVMIATVRSTVMLSLFTDFENFATFKPSVHHDQEVHAMLDQVAAWAGALTSVRAGLQTGHQAERAA
jgi:NAD(P)H-dependent FMN reductase